jgi:O-antigen/teichoic acid export membrane protein
MNRIIRNILWVSISITVSKGIGMATSFVMPKLLGPDNFGIWVTMLLIVQYAPIACLGTGESLVRMFPYYSARRDFGKTREIENGVFGSVVIASVLFLLLSLLFLFIINVPDFNVVLPLARVMVLAASVSLFSAFFSLRLVAHQNFKMVGFSEILRSIVTFFILVSFTYAWSLEGSAFGYLSSEIIVCTVLAIFSYFACGEIGIKFSPHLLLWLVRVGLPITMVWWVYILQTTAGSLISINLLGKTSTGYLGLGISISSILVLIPDAVNRVLYPRINEEVGKGSDFKTMERIVIMPSLITSFILALSIGIIVLIMPISYYILFERYLPGLLCGQILIFGAFFNCLVRSGANFLIAKDKQYIVLKFVLIGLGANISCNIILIQTGFGIEGISLGTALSSILVTSMIWISVFRLMGQGKTEQWKSLFNLYSPFLLAIILILILKMVFRGVLVETGPISFLYITLFFALFAAISYFLFDGRRWFEEVYRSVKMTEIAG